MRSDFDVEAGPLNISLSQGFGFTTTKICLDPGTRMMRIDRKNLGFSKEPLEIPFHDISRLEKRSYANEYATTHTIRLELRSGERYFVNGGNAKITAGAVEAMTSFLDLRPEDAANTGLAKHNRRMDLFWTILALLIFAYPVFQSVRSHFVLPDCDDKEIKTTVIAIISEHGGGVDVELSDIATLADAKGGRTCQALWSRDGADVVVNYRIAWDGWTPNVRASWRR